MFLGRNFGLLQILRCCFFLLKAGVSSGTSCLGISGCSLEWDFRGCT